MKERPLFIVFEGLDGSGKTTQIKLLKEKFETSGLKVTDTHEPTDGPVGMMIRNVMRGRIQMDQPSLAALFLADRLDHINNPIDGMKARMEEGFNIICSRYYFSNYAFQSEFVPPEWLVQCNSLCKTYLKPDLIFYLDVDPAECNERISKSRVNIEIYENLEKLVKTHTQFLEAFEQYGRDENIHIIKGRKSIEETHRVIWDITKKQIATISV